MNDKKILEEMLTVIMQQSFLDGYLERRGLYGKPRDEYTVEEEKIYQDGIRFAHKYVLSNKGEQMINIQDKTLRTISAEHSQWVDSDGEEGVRADFSMINLSYVNLYKADLHKADLTEVNLYKANLYKANLIEANLHKANLYKADLHKADLYKANLHKADLTEANLHKANLYKANLHKADLTEADLIEAIRGNK